MIACPTSSICSNLPFRYAAETSSTPSSLSSPILSRHRSTGPAILLAFAGKSWALGQLWLFWVAPIFGGVIGALIYRAMAGDDTVSDAAVMEVT